MAGCIKTCETCRHGYLGPGYQPCMSCGDDCSNWEPNAKFVEERLGEAPTYTYFVSYTATNQNGDFTVNNGIVDRNQKITTRDDLWNISESIRRDSGLSNIVILNWKELEG